MPLLLANMLAAAISPHGAIAPESPPPSSICAVGRAALRDLPAPDRNRSADLYYGALDNGHRDLLSLCPQLKDRLPVGYSLANDDARRRAATHAPIEGYDPRPAYIYVIDEPRFSSDLKSAMVRFEYSCTGLCGGAFEAEYRLTLDGWQRQADLKPIYVS
jgi:hypothetical protein